MAWVKLTLCSGHALIVREPVAWIRQLGPNASQVTVLLEDGRGHRVSWDVQGTADDIRDTIDRAESPI